MKTEKIELNTATKILSNNLDIDIETEEIKTICALCGTIINEAIQIKNVISSNFTNFEYFKYKTNYLCKNCSKCLKDNKLRKNNFIADQEKIIFFKHNDIEKYIFNVEKYIKIPFVLAITRTFKKHNSFKCILNYSYKYFQIQEEDKKYIFDLETMKKLYKKLNEAYLYFTKEEMLRGNYNLINIEKYGKGNFIELEKILKQYRETHQFNLLIYMLNSEKRNEYIIKKKEEERKWKKKQENMQ